MNINSPDPIANIVRYLAESAARQHLSGETEKNINQSNQSDNKKPTENVIDLKKIAS